MIRQKNAAASRLGLGCPELDNTAGGEDGCDKQQHNKVRVVLQKQPDNLHQPSNSDYQLLGGDGTSGVIH